MYFFVPYNISPIQQAIQAGHSAIEYARQYADDYEFQNFADEWKTWIILNGGTTNSRVRKDVINLRDEIDPYEGSMDNLYVNLISWNADHKNDKINSSIFQEPDLNDALTAICFIADERVFNYEDYPEFDDWFCIQDFPDDTSEWRASYTVYDKGNRAILFPEQYKHWVTSVMGSEKNVFLRQLLKGKKLA